MPGKHRLPQHFRVSPVGTAQHDPGTPCGSPDRPVRAALLHRTCYEGPLRQGLRGSSIADITVTTEACASLAQKSSHTATTP
jgi:hypothetical protein